MPETSDPTPSPIVAPVNPPSEPSCYPAPTGHIQDAHKNEVKFHTADFCRHIATGLVTDLTVDIVKGDVGFTRPLDDVYVLTVKSVDNCTPDGGFNLAEPVPGYFSQDILFNALWNGISKGVCPNP